jgi:hypothetical protein
MNQYVLAEQKRYQGAKYQDTTIIIFLIFGLHYEFQPESS